MIDRPALRRMAGKLAPRIDDALSSSLGERVGFLLFLFDFKANPEDDGKGSMVYITNGEREGLINTVKEVLAYLEAGLLTEPDGDRAQG